MVQYFLYLLVVGHTKSSGDQVSGLYFKVVKTRNLIVVI